MQNVNQDFHTVYKKYHQDKDWQGTEFFKLITNRWAWVIKVPWYSGATHDSNKACSYPWQPWERQPPGTVTLIESVEILIKTKKGGWVEEQQSRRQVRSTKPKRKAGKGKGKAGTQNTAGPCKPYPSLLPESPFTLPFTLLCFHSERRLCESSL